MCVRISLISFLMSRPKIRAVPDDGGWNPSSVWISVVLPAPFGPSSPMQRPRSAPLMSCRMRRLPNSIRSWSSSMIGFIALTRSSLLRDVFIARLDLEAAEWAVLACDAKIENHLDRKTIVRFQPVEILKDNALRQPDALLARGEIVIRFSSFERPRLSIVAKEYLIMLAPKPPRLR